MLGRKLKRCFKSSYKGILLSCIIVGYIYTCLGLLGNLGFTEYITERSMTSLDIRKFANHSNIAVTESTRNTVKPMVVKVPVNTHNCTQWFEDTMEANLDVIKKYPRGDADMYLSNISGDSQTPKQLMTSFPVVVTAANAAFYKVSQGLLKSIHEILLPKYTEIKIIYYDMGLTDSQRSQLIKYCKCEVRIFPFEKFPAHVRKLKTYTWKPLIVKMLQMEYKWVWWMDSSVRFITNQLDSALSYSKDNSLLFFTYGVVLSVAYQTDTQTMKYFGEDTCKYRHFGEIEATFLLFYSDHVTDTIVDQWAACALNEACMAPPGTNKKLRCGIHKKYDGRCHRFDQSVIGILLRRLYHDHDNYPLVDEPFKIHVIKRGNAVSYFPG